MKIHDIIENVQFELGDSFDIELGTTLIETGIIGFTDDGIILESDIKSLALLKTYGAQFEQTDINLNEGRMSEVDVIFQELANGVRDVFTIMMSPETPEETYVAEKLQDMFHDVSEDFGLDPKKDLEKILLKIGDRLYDEYADEESQDNVDLEQSPKVAINEAEYQGRKVALGKPMQGDVKKSKVYVKGPKGNVVKVNFGDKKMKIKKSNPKRRKSFRARHNCDNPGPRWKARYWSCRAW